MKVNSSRNPYVIPDVKGNDTLAIPCILIGGINVAGNGRLRSKWYEGGIEQKSKNVLGVANRTYGKNICLWKGRGGKGKKNNYSKKVFNGFKPMKGVPCYKCGKEGHWSRTCPNGPAKKDKENTAKTSY
ncbi:TIMELESS-interacting protein [Tanacetum coccineum]